MKGIIVLDQLELSSEGVFANQEKIALRQGDIDGACGPYSILMGLIYHGVVTRAEVTSPDRVDGRTRLGKFLDGLCIFDTMVRKGTKIDELEWLVGHFKSSPEAKVDLRTLESESTRELAYEISECIDTDNPVVVGIDWQGGGAHWALVVGYEYFENQDDTQIITKLYLLDPGFEGPTTTYWNAVIQVADNTGSIINSGRFPSNHWSSNANKPTLCKIFTGLALEQN
ncbi:hypothetical protein ACROAH_11715 [Shewanella oncorhynchi]|uniref:hypothetical protein n=1 Tax=Shewanella oncorhynchi TaxID=2726434 RepID=UPI003D78E436